MSLAIVRTVAQLREQVRAWREQGLRVGVVPTMGALHAGHMSLVQIARANTDRVIVTLFVNPTQFNSQADLAAYPRTEDTDSAMLAGEGVDVLYAPGVEEMYPEGFSTKVIVSGVSEGLCGAYRPGHFEGVATVVAKLLLQSGADVAVFGEKDFQQLAVIRRLAADLDIPVEIVGAPTVRSEDGLALSSRNARLSARGRQIAPALAKALETAVAAIEVGHAPDKAIEVARGAIIEAGFADVEYLEYRDAATLSPTVDPGRPGRLLVAAWLEGVRLIDNLAVRPR